MSDDERRCREEGDVMSDTDMYRIVAEIRALSAPQQLRLAADLLDAKRDGIARQVAHAAVLRLDAAALGIVLPKETT